MNVFRHDPFAFMQKQTLYKPSHHSLMVSTDFQQHAHCAAFMDFIVVTVVCASPICFDAERSLVFKNISGTEMCVKLLEEELSLV